MPEKAELIIDSQMGGAVRDFENLDTLNRRLQDGMETTRVKISGVEVSLNSLGKAAREQVERALNGVTDSANKAVTAVNNLAAPAQEQKVSRLAAAMERLAKAQAGVGSSGTAIPLGASQAPLGTGIGSATSGVIPGERQTRQALGAKFEAAARALNEGGADAERGLNRAASAAQKADNVMHKLEGTAREVKNVFKEEIIGGSGLGGFLQGGIDALEEAGGAFAGLASGVILGIGAIAVQKTEEMKQKALDALNLIKQSANLGLRGGFEQRATELEKLQNAKDEIIQRRLLGESNADISVLGRDENRGIGNESDLDVKLKKAEETARKIENLKFNRGADNIFDNAAKSLRSLAESANDTAGTARDLERLRQAFTKGDIETVADYNKEVAKLQANLEKMVAFQQQAEQSRQESLDRVRLGNEIFGGLRNQFDSLRVTATQDNPFVQIFESAERRAEDFRAQFGFLGNRIVEQFREANRKVLELELFKGNLASQGRINELLQSAGELRNNPLLREAFGDNRAAARLQTEITATGFEAEARRLRGQNFFSPGEDLRRRVEQIAGGLSGTQRARAIEELTRGVDSDTLRSANLDRARAASLDDLAQETRRRQEIQEAADRRRVEFAEKSITDAEARLAGTDFAKDSPERRAAELQSVDFILAALGKIDPSKLPPQLLDAQLKFTERRLELERTAQEDAKKQIEAQTALLTSLKTLVENLPNSLKSAAVVELRDRAAIGTFTFERTGGTSIDFEE